MGELTVSTVLANGSASQRVSTYTHLQRNTSQPDGVHLRLRNIIPCTLTAVCDFRATNCMQTYLCSGSAKEARKSDDPLQPHHLSAFSTALPAGLFADGNLRVRRLRTRLVPRRTRLGASRDAVGAFWWATFTFAYSSTFSPCSC